MDNLLPMAKMGFGFADHIFAQTDKKFFAFYVMFIGLIKKCN